MPFLTGMNNQESTVIADVNTEVVGLSPSIAMANTYMQTSQAIGLAALNSVQAQQETWIISRAALSKEVTNILRVPPFELATATENQGLN